MTITLGFSRRGESSPAAPLSNDDSTGQSLRQ
jgi:hypothetical protein